LIGHYKQKRVYNKHTNKLKSEEALMTQPTMEGINPATPNSGTPLDLRTPEGEAAKAAELKAKADRLAEQANSASVSAPGVDGFTPAPASPATAIGAPVPQLPNETKAPAFALPAEPSKPAEELAPGAITTEGTLGSIPTDSVATPQATQVASQPTKKIGFFGRLFGKK